MTLQKLKTLGKFTLALALISLIAWGAFPSVTNHSGEYTINKAERVTTDGKSQYMIYTAELVFKNVDDIRIWKFNSSDIYAKLKDGDVVTIDSYGLRLPFLSIYPNIKAIR